jgi:mRNA interferase HigB
MVIFSKSTITQFAEKYPDVQEALMNWFRVTKLADWSCFADVKKDFNAVDSVGNDRFVFDIKGNHYRLIALIFFNKRTVMIRFIGTHKEYDKIIAKNV